MYVVDRVFPYFLFKQLEDEIFLISSSTYTNCKGNYKVNAFPRTTESGRTARNCRIHIDNLTVQQTLRRGFDDFTTGEYTYTLYSMYIYIYACVW